MPENDHAKHVLEMVSRLLHEHPRLADDVERLAAYVQGKGYGADSIAQEISVLESLSASLPKLAVDIGGNVGNYTAELRKRHPDLEIHTFEPSGVNVRRLLQRFAGDERIHVVPLAVSNAEGSAVLYSNEQGSGLGSLTKRRLDHFDIPFDTEEKVKTVRFEDYWRTRLESRPLDMVKIDVEGHELSVLRGFGEALRHCAAIQFEFGGCNIDTRTYFQDFWYFFRENGFDIHRIAPFGAQRLEHYSENDEYFSTTNYVAVRAG